MPDVLGMNLDVAEEYLCKTGVIYDICETKPPAGYKNVELTGCFRVVGQRNEDDRVILIVCKIPDPFD